jgi:hypothetical protein
MAVILRLPSGGSVCILTRQAALIANGCDHMVPSVSVAGEKQIFPCEKSFSMPSGLLLKRDY